MNRREWLRLSAGGAVAALVAGAVPVLASAPAVTVTVYKDPNCGCCVKWVDHLRAAGFEVVSHDTREMASVKASLGVPARLNSCHTGAVGGYVLEGHVPADLVKRLLKERPKVAGLAVPGMPMGSPGMEGPTKDRYEVLAFDTAGKTTVYAVR